MLNECVASDMVDSKVVCQIIWLCKELHKFMSKIPTYNMKNVYLWSQQFNYLIFITGIISLQNECCILNQAVS